MAALDVILLLASVIVVAYVGVPVIIWTIVVGVVLILVTILGGLNALFLTLCWIFYLAAVAFANLTELRQKYFTKPLIKKLQQNMPSISDTERDAIEAGNVWWEKDLFCGRPDWKKLHSYPQPKLTDEEQSFVDNQVETLCSMLNDWEIVNDERNMPKRVWDYLKKERFLGLVIPKQYGGHGFSAYAHSTIIMKIASRCVSAAVNTMVPNSLGPGELLSIYGTQEQKDYYLPRLAAAEDIPCFALTSPECGSDAAAITDHGIVCHGEYDGKKVLGMRLNWDKRYITLAPVGTVLGLAFRLYDPENLLGKDEEDIGITLCLVPTNRPGVEIGDRHLPLHLAFMNGPTRGKDVFVPLDAIIGGPEMAGKGWKMLMEALSIGRSISLPALSAATGKLCYRTSGAYARLRRQFNTSLSNFEGIEELLGNIAGLAYTTEACRIMTAGAVDLHIRPAIASAISKYHMTEMARKMITHAMDINAGHAIQVGPRNYLAPVHMAIPVSITVEGANVLTRCLIIFGQGAIRCHPYILDEIALFNEPDSAEKVKKLDRILLSHIGYMVSNTLRSLWMGLTGGYLVMSPVRGPISRYYKQLTRMSSALAFLADASMMLLGGTLKRRESISARLGDIMSQLYLASAVLKYYQDHGQPASDVDYVKWSIDNCLYEIQVACDRLLHNFPMKWLGKLLHWVVFPFGISYRKPSDTLYRSLVETMTTPSDFRDRLTKYFYISDDENDPIQRQELALEQLIEAEPVLKKFQNGIKKGLVPKHLTFEEQVHSAVKSKNITKDEANVLTKYNALIREVIKVNEFTFDLSQVVS